MLEALAVNCLATIALYYSNEVLIFVLGQVDGGVEKAQLVC
jgi:hypothetical protein